jgi:hypothetical protein
MGCAQPVLPLKIASSNRHVGNVRLNHASKNTFCSDDPNTKEHPSPVNLNQSKCVCHDKTRQVLASGERPKTVRLPIIAFKRHYCKLRVLGGKVLSCKERCVIIQTHILG